METGYEWLDGRKSLAGMRQQQVRVGARYGLDGEIARFVVGADYYHDMISGEENGNYIIPFARLDFVLGAHEFKPFLELDGGVRDNSFRSLARQNPYVRSGVWGNKSSVDYNVRIGLGGSLWRDRFDYRVYAAFSVRDHHLFWYGDLLADDTFSQAFSGELLPALSRQTVTSFHGEVVYRPVSQLRMDLGVHGFLYNDEALFIYGHRNKLENGEPAFRADAAVRYVGRKIAFGISARAESRRRWSVFVEQDGERSLGRYSVPFAVDLGVDFQWKISGRVSLFAEGRNLLDRRLYDYPWYPGYRVNCTVGAKVSF